MDGVNKCDVNEWSAKEGAKKIVPETAVSMNDQKKVSKKCQWKFQRYQIRSQCRYQLKKMSNKKNFKEKQLG